MTGAGRNSANGPINALRRHSSTPSIPHEMEGENDHSEINWQPQVNTPRLAQVAPTVRRPLRKSVAFPIDPREKQLFVPTKVSSSYSSLFQGVFVVSAKASKPIWGA